MASTRDFKRRIRSVKNTQQITRAMKLVAASKVRRAQERIESARPYGEKMEELVNSLAAKVSADTHPLLRDDMKDDRVLLLVITSDKEGMSGAMLEAMARGVPVISTDVSGALEALEPETDGQAPGLVTGFAPPQIASALNSVLYDRKLLEEMGRAAERCYRERFSYERMLDRWELLLYGSPRASRS